MSLHFEQQDIVVPGQLLAEGDYRHGDGAFKEHEKVFAAVIGLVKMKGKTIYVVDDGFVGGDNLLHEMVAWFEREMPNTKAIYKRKGGMGFEAEDPELWAEMKESADGIIIGMGH